VLGFSTSTDVIAAANLLLVADGRFPAGGYAHSYGIEHAIETGRVDNEQALDHYLRGLLATTARTSACFAAASCAAWHGEPSSLELLAREESARIPAPPLREASRAQGRQYLRAAAGTWPEAQLAKASIVPGGVHLSMAQGLVAAALKLDPTAAALISGYGAVTGAAAAAVKLLGLDPLAVNRVVARQGEALAILVDEAGDLAAGCPPSELPSRTAPLLESGAALHALRQPRMFAS
jgi:urease accessory protein